MHLIIRQNDQTLRYSLYAIFFNSRKFTEKIRDVTGGSLLSVNISVNFRNIGNLRVKYELLTGKYMDFLKIKFTIGPKIKY